MNIDDVRTLAGAILGPQLEPFGYQDVDVQDYVDSAGEEALQIIARLRPDGPLIPGDVFMRIGQTSAVPCWTRASRGFPIFGSITRTTSLSMTGTRLQGPGIDRRSACHRC